MVLTSCAIFQGEYTDGEQQVTSEMNETISSYIVDKYVDIYGESEKQFEVHKVYGTKETNGTITVYMWSYYAGYSGTDQQSGHSLPAVIELKKADGTYKVIGYKEPEDGSYYQSSLKKMFPNKYLKMAHKDSGNIADLQKEMDIKVEQWLEEQN